MNTFTHNLELLTRRHPELGRYLAAIAAKEKVASVRTEDGAHCFVLAMPDGKWQALTSTENPLRKAQSALDAMEGRLERGLAPAVIAGLQAGLELEAIFNSFRQNFHQKQIPRRILVITESPLILLAWLHHSDRSDILNCPLVEWYRPGADLDALIRRMDEDDCLSHNFAPVSSLPQAQIEQLISPLTRLFLKRQEQERSWRLENEHYYYSDLGDAELSRTLAGQGSRKPRALLFAHASSTVVQFSMRDTRWALEQAGWEVDFVLMSEELPPWLIQKRLAMFRPDLALMVNHLRSEDPVGFWPENLLFVTWIQDTCPDIMKSEAARKWREQSAGRQRDLIIGYVDQIRPFGYPAERLRSCGMITSPASLDPGPGPFEIEADVCFASNCSKTSEQLIAEDLLPKLSSKGIDAAMLGQFDSVLWRHYRGGNSYISLDELSGLISRESPRLAQALTLQSDDDRRYTLDRLFWEHNNLVYRHVVLEWLEDAGCSLALYGRGWERHPRFGRWAKGVVAHGPELGRAFRKSRFALHLNPNEGSHQRLIEIVAAGATPLIRRREKISAVRSGAHLLHARRQNFPEKESLLASSETWLSMHPTLLGNALRNYPDLVLYGCDSPVFNTPAEMKKCLERTIPSTLKELLKPCLLTPGQHLLTTLKSCSCTTTEWQPVNIALGDDAPSHYISDEVWFMAHLHELRQGTFRHCLIQDPKLYQILMDLSNGAPLHLNQDDEIGLSAIMLAIFSPITRVHESVTAAGFSRKILASWIDMETRRIPVSCHNLLQLCTICGDHKKFISLFDQLPKEQRALACRFAWERQPEWCQALASALKDVPLQNLNLVDRALLALALDWSGDRSASFAMFGTCIESGQAPPSSAPGHVWSLLWMLSRIHQPRESQEWRNQAEKSDPTFRKWLSLVDLTRSLTS